MEALQAILTRRSIRKYKKDPVDDSTIRKVLECGFAAPTAKNRKPLHYIVIKDRDVLSRLGSMHMYAGMVEGSAFSILVCGDYALEDRRQFIDQDGGAACENMLVGANAMGLGGVWCGVPEGGEREDAIRKICRIPPGITPVALLAFGVPDEVKETPDRYDASRVREDVWE
ncbi:MAG: nitroreductase family protein [Firmicutes bacterium]|nr:nitroreductase family protein [Bacillota bacterium]